MGGFGGGNFFSLGELAGVLKLDDSQARQALAETSAALALMKVRTTEVTNVFQALTSDLRRAGFDMAEVNKLFKDFNRLGYDNESAASMIVSGISSIREEASRLRIEAIQAKNEVNNLLGSRGFSGSGLTPSQDAERRRALVAQQAFEVTSRQRQEYDAIAERDRISLAMAKEKYRVEQDYLGLVAKLRAQQNSPEKAAGDKEGQRQEAEYARNKFAAETAAAQNYRNLVQQLRAEEVAAAQKAGQKIEADAKKRQTEIQDQMVRDAQARLRMEQEENAERERQTRAAQARERAAFFEHRRQMQAASAATTVGITAMAIGGAGVAAGGFVAKDAAQFQDAMAKSLAVIGDLGDGMRDRLAQAARDAAKETGLAAKEIAEDYAIAAKGGLTAAESLEFVPKAAKFAIATNSELHESTRQIITILEALQIPASQAAKVMDELTVANQLSRGSVDQLATALEGKSGAALRSANVRLEEALALTTAFSRAGVTAAQSQTFLTQVVERLTYAARAYGKEQVNVGNETMKFHDILYMADGSVRPFIQTLKLLDTAFQGKSADKIGKFFDDIHLGSARGAQALKIVLSQADMLDLLVQQYDKASGAMVKAFDMQMMSPIRQLARLRTNLQDVAITLGIPLVSSLQSAAVALSPVLHMVQDLADEFAHLPPGVQVGAMSLAGIGTTALLAGGGVMVLLGHVIRLQADLKLLTGMEGFAGLFSMLGPVLSRLGAVGIAIAGITVATTAMVKEYNRIKDDQSRNGKREDGLGIGKNDTFYGFGYVPHADPSEGKTKESIEAHRRLVEQSKSDGDKLLDKIGKVETDNSMDKVREMLEQFKKGMKDVLEGGTLAVNPDKVLKEQLTADSIRQKLAEFSNEYSQIVDKLTDQEQSVITDGEHRLLGMLNRGVDPKLIMSAYHDLDAQLTRFKESAAQRTKAEDIAQQREAAKDSAFAFIDRYIDELRQFSPRQKAVMQQAIDDLENLLVAGADPKAIRDRLREAEEQYRDFAREIDNARRVQEMLDRTQSKYETKERREQRQKREVPIYPEGPIGDYLKLVAPFTKQQLVISSLMKSASVESEGDIKVTSGALAGLYAELKQTSASTNELREVWLRAKEAFYRADEGLKPLHEDFVRVRTEMDRLRSEGSTSDRMIALDNLQIQAKALDWQLNGLGKTYHNTLQALSGGFNQLGQTIARSILQIKDFGKIWKETLQGVVEGVMGAFIQGLINMAAAWIAKSLGIAAATKGVAMSQVFDAAAVAEANTIAAISMIPIVGPALAPAAGQAQYALTLATALPKLAAYEYGGKIDKDKIAMVHSGEYVATSRLTKGLEAMVAQGGMTSGGGDYFDFRGASFGAGLSQAKVDTMMKEAVGKLRRAGGKSRQGRF